MFTDAFEIFRLSRFFIQYSVQRKMLAFGSCFRCWWDICPTARLNCVDATVFDLTQSNDWEVCFGKVSRMCCCMEKVFSWKSIQMISVSKCVCFDCTMKMLGQTNPAGISSLNLRVHEPKLLQILWLFQKKKTYRIVGDWLLNNYNRIKRFCWNISCIWVA